MPKSRTDGQTVQRWGNSLAVRIPASVAKSVGLKAGQPVELSAHDSSLLVTPRGDVRLSLSQKLALFDPHIHGGEAMALPTVGKEKL